MRLLYIPLLLALSIEATAALAQEPVLLKRDAGNPSSHDNAAKPGWEETMILVPAGPCRLLEAHIYLSGSKPGHDTIYIVGDPAEGAIPATSYVWSYNTLTEPIVVE